MWQAKKADFRKALPAWEKSSSVLFGYFLLLFVLLKKKSLEAQIDTL